MGALRLNNDFLRLVSKNLGTNEKKCVNAYRFGFNGMEKDDEVFNSTGSSYTAEFWQYDSRLGRRWNIDPVVKPWESSYATFANNPILYVDTKGDDIIPSDKFKKSPYGTVLKKLSSNSVYRELSSSFSIPSKMDIRLDFQSYNKRANATTSSRAIAPLSFNLVSTDIKFNSDRFNSYHNETFNFTEINGRSEIAMARTILHEFMHTDLFGENEVAGEHHEVMAKEKNRNIIIKGLKEYASENGMEYSGEEYEVLSWGGLYKTEAFKEKYNTAEKVTDFMKTKKRLENTIDIIDDEK